MAGVTDSPFRSLCKKLGAALVYSEMVSAKGLYYGGKNTEALLFSTPQEEPLAVQIFGREPEIMAEMAKKLEQRGVSMIDINSGCPAPKIVRNGEGSALMREPEQIGKIVSAVSRAVSIPVTVKIRKGFDASRVNAPECAKIAEEAGAAAVCVHGRTRTQQYSGTADWDIIRRVKETVKIPVIGNGDVISGESAARMLSFAGCDFVMVGRGACGNPWIFREINHFLKTGEKPPSPTLAEIKDAALSHAEALIGQKGEHTAMQEMRKHISWYVKGHRGAGALRREINKITTFNEMNAILELLED